MVEEHKCRVRYLGARPPARSTKLCRTFRAK